MIISRTPYRITFVGGGSDIPAFYEQEDEGGKVINAAINKYLYVTLNNRHDSQVVVSYVKREEVSNVKNLQHDLARNTLSAFNLAHGLEITSIGELPKEIGLGSSGSYIVGLINAILRYKRVFFESDFEYKKEVANMAAYIEIVKCKKPVGKQDQYIASLGKIQYLNFLPSGAVETRSISCEDLKCHLLLFYTGLNRSSDSILTDQTSMMEQIKKRTIVQEMTKLTQPFESALIANDYKEAGCILNENWKLKKLIVDKISNEYIDKYYALGINNGAYGGKLLGAGGGGCLLFIADPLCHNKIEGILNDLQRIHFDFDHYGSTIIYSS